MSVSVPAPLAARRGVPSPVLAAIAVAWVAAVVAELSGVAGSVHHDNLLESGPVFGPALLFFLLAWQVMTAAMMLPSSLPLVTMYVVASAHAPGGRAALAPSSAAMRPCGLCSEPWPSWATPDCMRPLTRVRG